MDEKKKRKPPSKKEFLGFLYVIIWAACSVATYMFLPEVTKALVSSYSSEEIIELVVLDMGAPFIIVGIFVFYASLMVLLGNIIKKTRPRRSLYFTILSFICIIFGSAHLALFTSTQIHIINPIQGNRGLAYAETNNLSIVGELWETASRRSRHCAMQSVLNFIPKDGQVLTIRIDPEEKQTAYAIADLIRAKNIPVYASYSNRCMKAAQFNIILDEARGEFGPSM